MRYWSECWSFFRETRRRFLQTGSILPSSRFLGRALASELGKPRGPARILEVGPGTGSVTREILRQLQPGDQLDLVEVNERFVDLLRGRIEKEPLFGDHRDHLQVIRSALENLPGDGIYDFIVSGLPINNFPVTQVREIFRAYKRLLKPGGALSFFEYVLIRQLKSPFVSRRERRRLYQVGWVVDRYIRDFQIRRQRVLINFPPAYARHLHFKANGGVIGGSEESPKAVAAK